MAVPVHIQSFIDDFYAKSDARDNAAWVACFTPDANLDMAGNVAKGSDGINKVCEGVWDGLERRQHNVHGVYVNPAVPDDVVILGNIDVDRTDGVQVRGREWGARMQLKDGKLADYRVWVVSLAGGAAECSCLPRPSPARLCSVGGRRNVSEDESSIAGVPVCYVALDPSCTGPHVQYSPINTLPPYSWCAEH